MKASSHEKVLLPEEWPGSHYYGEEEREAVGRVAGKASPFRFYGLDLQHEADQFENEFAQYIGVNYCLGVSSGTAALQVALAAMGIGPGDEVLLPGYLWVSTISAVVRSGAVPSLVDVDESYSLDPSDLQRKITRRTRAVIMVHMGGVIGQVTRVAEICKEHHLMLLEDCAQAAGASQFVKKAGSFGDMAIFSFQLNKNITAGEGGAVVTCSKELYNRAFAIHDLGYVRNEKGKLDFENPGSQYWGIGCRMSEFTAAVMRVQLRKLDDIVGSMRSFKKELVQILSSCEGVETRHLEDPEGDSGGFLKIRFRDRETAYRFKEGLLSNGIQVKEGGYYPIHMTEWGLHIYSNNKSLVHKRSICGHHSVWELKENRWARHYRYGEGTLPNMDSYVQRTVIFCVASRLSDTQKSVIRSAFDSTCSQLKLKRSN
jgi:dTDP-4-amino-4,6-dideoxygalactose transaminase